MLRGAVKIGAPFKKLLKKSDIILGCWQFTIHPNITELISVAGYDFVVIDNEHTSASFHEVAHCILAADAVGLMSIVRVPEKNQQFMIEQVLDAGANGILVPTVETKEEAEAAVRAALFPPLGKRGWCPQSRSGRFGAVDREMYALTANEETFVGVIVETLEGLKNLQEIVQVKGLNAVMVGPADLAVDMGVSTTGDPFVAEKISQAHEIIRAARKWPWVAKGGNIGSSRTEMLSQGVKMANVAIDGAIILKGLSASLEELAERDS